MKKTHTHRPNTQYDLAKRSPGTGSTPIWSPVTVTDLSLVVLRYTYMWKHNLLPSGRRGVTKDYESCSALLSIIICTFLKTTLLLYLS